MQGGVVFKDAHGNILWSGSASSFPLEIECESHAGNRNFVIRYSYAENPDRHGFTDKSKIKGIVMMKKV